MYIVKEDKNHGHYIRELEPIEATYLLRNAYMWYKKEDAQLWLSKFTLIYDKSPKKYRVDLVEDSYVRDQLGLKRMASVKRI